MEGNKAVMLAETDLQLVVSTKTLGSLTTNAEKIRDMVKAALPQYSIENYSSSDVAKAKEDKSKLNKAAKALNDERIKIEKEWMKPFGDFKEVVTETVSLIKNCVASIDTIIKEDDERTKNAKREQVERLAETCGLEVVGIKLEKIWNEKWLNKTTSLKSIEKEITEKVASIKNDLETLKTFAEDYDALVTYYKENLNLSETVAYANRLIEARKAKAEVKQEAPVETPVEAPAVEQKEEEKPQQNSNKADSTLLDAEDAFAAAMGMEIAPAPSVMELQYKVKVTQSQKEELEKYMAQLGISFNII